MSRYRLCGPTTPLSPPSSLQLWLSSHGTHITRTRLHRHISIHCTSRQPRSCSAGSAGGESVYGPLENRIWAPRRLIWWMSITTGVPSEGGGGSRCRCCRAQPARPPAGLLRLAWRGWSAPSWACRPGWLPGPGGSDPSCMSDRVQPHIICCTSILIAT